MKTSPQSSEQQVPKSKGVESEPPFHQPQEEEEIKAANAGLSTGSREEGPSQQDN